MKRTLPFLFALFATSSVFAQGTVQSGPAYSIPAYGTPGPSTTVGPSNIFTDATLKNVYVPGGVYVAGPNPWIDITQPPYNARAVTSISAATATCNGTTTVSITAGASQFQTNDGIVLEGCGPSVPATAAYQPSSVSVTPVMQSGGDPHYDVASAAAGSTPYTYSVATVEGVQTSASPLYIVGGGVTAAVSATTNTGNSLGTQTYTVSSMTRTGSQVSIQTSAANLASTGAAVCVYGSSDGSFEGCYIVASITNSTTFVVNTGRDTSGVGPVTTSATGGTLRMWSGNLISWTAPSSVVAARTPVQYIVCKGTSVIGMTRPGETQFVDYGQTFEPVPALPPYIPTTCPSAAGSQYLATTITAGGGTGTITIAQAASQSVAGVNAYFDDGPAFQAALNTAIASTGASAIHIPAAPASNYFYPLVSSVLAYRG
jgi:hypothetical protein